MLRPFLTFVAASVAAPALAQTSGAAAQSTDCQLRINPTPASWIITGFDPFADAMPEGTFGVTFVNEGGAECRFTPTFELRQPPFGLSKGMGKPVRYALLNLTDTHDVTPRSGRSQRLAARREIVVQPKESRSIMYKLIVDPTDVRAAGTFTQDVTLEAQDRDFRSLGGSSLVLGITVLPSARIGLAGAYRMSDGQAVVNLGELKQGIAPVPLQLRVNSTGEYDISVTSANSGQLRLGSTQWFVPYSVAIGNESFNLSGTRTVSGTIEPERSRGSRDSLPFRFIIGDVSNKRAGVYSDVISVSITAR
ncbi:hypothetical protein [Parasphingorhabdus sp.]|uniref:hypothetical protein n=1 Tax=Parasphingorhabdus sp. TaxID=2709688 RepID=UPI003A9244EA